MLILSGEAKDPDAVYESISRKISSLDYSGFDRQLLNTMIKGGYGSEIMKYNNVSECAESMCFCYVQGVSCFDNLKIMSDLTPEEVFETTRLLDMDRSSFCIVRK